MTAPEPSLLENTLLLLFVTPTEQDGIFNSAREAGLTPKPIQKGRLSYHDFGSYENCRIFALRTEMGSESSGGSLASTMDAIREIDPDYLIAVGIAFGMKDKKHGIGDILVSERLVPYEALKISRDEKTDRKKVIKRHGIPSAPVRILNRFKTAQPYWNLTNEIPVHFGTLLSGAKLIDDRVFKARLTKDYPEAIGGEMEGSGFCAASEFNRKDWIVVKAICDWAENKSENKDESQKIAAANSADFVFYTISLGLFGNKRDQTDPGPNDQKPDDPKKRETPPGSNLEIKKKIHPRIIEILKQEKLKYLKQSLVEALELIPSEMVEHSICMDLTGKSDLLDSIFSLGLAVKASFRQIKIHEEQVHDHITTTWTQAVNILGYLVLLLVDYDWVQKANPLVVKGVKLEIPVVTDAGIEIVYSGLTATRARLETGESGVYVNGKDRIDYRFPESGFDTEDTIHDIKTAIFKKLYPPDLKNQKSLLYSGVKLDLNQVLKRRRKAGYHHYICVDEKDCNHPLELEKVYLGLKDELKELDIISISLDDSKKALIVSEPALNADLTEFFRNKPEF